MRVFLDDQELPADTDWSVASAIHAAADAARRSRRVIIEVKGDGSPLPEPILIEPPSDDAGYQTLRFRSVEPRALVRESLLEAGDALQGVSEIQRKAAERFQVGDTETALADLTGALTVWQQVRETLEKSVSMVDIDLSAVSMAEGRTAADEVTALTLELATLKSSIESEDWVQLSDLLGYELVTRAEGWRQMLRRVAEHVRLAGTLPASSHEAGSHADVPTG